MNFKHPEVHVFKNGMWCNIKEVIIKYSDFRVTCRGCYSRDSKEITLCDNGRPPEETEEKTVEILNHEVMHAILHDMFSWEVSKKLHNISLSPNDSVSDEVKKALEHINNLAKKEKHGG